MQGRPGNKATSGWYSAGKQLHMNNAIYTNTFLQIFNATKSIARIVNFILAVLLLAHWNGCIQFLVPFIAGFPSDSWVSINNLQVCSLLTICRSPQC